MEINEPNGENILLDQDKQFGMEEVRSLLEESDFEEVKEEPKVESKASLKERLISNIRSTAVRSVFVLSMFGASISGAILSSCSTMPIETQNPPITTPLPSTTPEQTEESEEMTETPTFIVEKPTQTITTPIITATVEPSQTIEPTQTEVVKEEEIPYVSTEKNELFDMESTNILEWENFTLEKDVILDESETVTTAGEKNDLYLLPGKVKDVLKFTDVVELNMPEGYTFNIKQKKVISNSDGESVTLGIVENTFQSYGSNSSFALLLSAKDSEGETQGFVEKNVERIPSVTTINSNPALARNDVKFQLLSSLRLSQSQINSGGLTNEISLKSLLEPIDSFEYFKFGNDSKYSLYVGTDTIATSLKLLSIKEPNLLSVVNSKDFAGGYMPGYFTFQDFDWDAAVGKEEGEDFVFKFNNNPEEKYMIKMDPIFANINNIESLLVEDNTPKIIYGVTLSLVKYIPEQKEEIQEQMQKQVEEFQTLYDNYLYYYERNRGKNNYDEGEDLIPMVIPRESHAEIYYLTDNSISNLIGDGKIFPFIKEEILTWMDKT